MSFDGKGIGDTKCTNTSGGQSIKRGDLVLVEHRKLNNGRAHSHKPSDHFELTRMAMGRCSLAMALDTKPEITYVVYVAGKGSEVKSDPFWIDNSCLIPYGDDHDSRHRH